ncbi:TFP11-domain-containing protein [Coprinopsis marcescibilis]|uniref:TFP11-domain-containing protein n=1 Tax=Coprinopsis marcescibilis TaxID=230819 RepID=A0A5C3LAU8_COPMA|nr:TFP11-domain-containing protein [Coprinopsis marcescibilis]
MARRKRVLDDGDDSDSSNNSDSHDFDDFDNNNPDLKEERALFENPYQRKRRKKNGKDDAIYGVFASDSEDEGYGRTRGDKPKRSDWTKAPAFVSTGKTVDLEETVDVDMSDGHDSEQDGEGDQVEDDGDSSTSSDSDREQQDEDDPPGRQSPILSDEPDVERPRFGGIGAFKSGGTSGEEPATGIGSSRGGMGASRGGLGAYAAFMTGGASGASRGGIGASRGGIGASRGGIGASRGGIGASKGGIGSNASVEEMEDVEDSSTHSTPAPDVPSAFGSRQQRFTRDETPAPKPALTADEMSHFSKLSGSFGARMLAKMGWQAGSGLGAEKSGIVTPIESKLRPQKMGIAFRGFKEKTEQSKREAKRRGEDVSDEEEDKSTKKLKKKAKDAQEKRSEAWKKPKKVKTKVQHKTYEQILEEAGDQAAPVGIGQIIDATGAVPREVSSLSEVNLNPWAPSNDPTRIPEVRHNIKLIADSCKGDLEGLAREAKALQERKKFVLSEDRRLRKKVDDEAELISRMQQIQIVANEIHVLSKELASMYEISLDPFSPLVHRLVTQFPNEFDKYQLDEVVVAAVAPLLRRLVASWEPLDNPAAFLTTFREWKPALKVNSDNATTSTQVDIYGAKTKIIPSEEKSMTPFESLLWNVWLPKVRTVINNEWSPEDPQPAVNLYESWSSFLPQFIKDNMLDQLFLPKVQKAVVDWSPKRSAVSLHTIVFPWLPHIGLRVDSVLDDARRKVRSLLKNWDATEPKPQDLHAWKDVFQKGDWDSMMLKYIVPKLGATLRTEFRVNPRAQKMEPLNLVLAWSDLIRSSIFSQILETEFFPKWLDVLHFWLIQPKISFEEVAQWYQFWKEVFPESISTLSGVNRGFTRGLQLMNRAIELGPEAPTRLVKPDFKAELAVKVSTAPTAKAADRPARMSARTQEITFRSIVEEFAAEHNLLFIPTGRAHENSRMPLYRVSETADGKHGLLVYILDDAVWAPKSTGGATESEDFRAIGLEDMVARARGS